MSDETSTTTEATEDVQPAATTETTPDKSGLSQDEVNKIVGREKAAAADKAVAKLLSDLGFEKPDDLKSLVQSVREKQDAEKSELQKAQDQLTKLQKQLEESQANTLALQKAHLEERRNAALLDAARTAHAEIPQDVVTWAKEHAASDLEALMGEQGVDEKAVAKLVEQCKKARPTWFKTGGPGSPSNRDGGLPRPSEDALRKQVAANIAQLTKRGF